MCQMTSEDIKHQLIIIVFASVDVKEQELRSCVKVEVDILGYRPLCGLRRRKAALNSDLLVLLYAQRPWGPLGTGAQAHHLLLQRCFTSRDP